MLDWANQELQLVVVDELQVQDAIENFRQATAGDELGILVDIFINDDGSFGSTTKDALNKQRGYTPFLESDEECENKPQNLFNGQEGANV